MNKIVLLAFVLMLLSAGVAVRFIRPAVAEGTIYIKADGSVEGTTRISSVDNVTYIFTDNINDSIVVEKDNIVVDGAGYTVQGTGSGYGIYLASINNVTIKNVEIKIFAYGIRIDYSSNNTISGNNITNNEHNGIILRGSSNNTLSGNNITNNFYGVYLGGSSNNMVYGNNITNSHYGICLYASSNNSISGNNIKANNWCGIWLTQSSNYNSIYHNNFIDNYQHVFTTNLTNIWDDGFEGNYWSDYEEKYPNATEIDGSGIWDTPYVIDENNQDNYPIVPEFTTWASMLLITIVLTVAIATHKRRLFKTPIH